MNREDEYPTTITYLDSDLLVIDSEPEDALIPSLFTRVDLQKLRSEETKERVRIGISFLGNNSYFRPNFWLIGN
jgi:hypothetical protein